MVRLAMEYIFVRFSDALALSYGADHNPGIMSRTRAASTPRVGLPSERTMAGEAVVQKARRLGQRQSIMRTIDHAIADLFPEGHSRTSAERLLAKDIHSLFATDHLHTVDLLILERIVGHIKVILDERARSH
jgi:hypothetical protein